MKKNASFAKPQSGHIIEANHLYFLLKVGMNSFTLNMMILCVDGWDGNHGIILPLF